MTPGIVVQSYEAAGGLGDLRRGVEAVMNRKEIRQASGYTFAGQQSNQDSWYRSAVSFHEAAELLWQHGDSIRMPVVLMNAALSVELLFKAIIVAKGGEAPINHGLVGLANDAGVAFSVNQKATLELLTELLIWSGRYPVPNTEKAWNHYNDSVLVRHTIEEIEGNTRRLRANPETFPSIENYEALWDLVIREWDGILLQQARDGPGK
jgi:HEPN domain-containing protein